MYAIGVSVVPYTVYDYYSMQNMANAAGKPQEEEQEFDLGAAMQAGGLGDIDWDTIPVDDEE